MKYFTIITILVLSFVVINCSCNCGQEDIDLMVHMKFEYKDEVNTFENYLKKDLVQDGVADTSFAFSIEQKHEILAVANEIGFFDLPEVIKSTADYEQEPTPGEQILRIKFEDWDHTVKWYYPMGKSENEQKIKKLSYFIMQIIIESPEYKALPKPTGGYL